MNSFAKKSVLADKNLVLLQRVVGEKARSRLTLVPVRKMSEEAAAQAGRSAGQFPISVLSRLKGSLTRDFLHQIFFINQCPPGP